MARKWENGAQSQKALIWFMVHFIWFKIICILGYLYWCCDIFRLLAMLSDDFNCLQKMGSLQTVNDVHFCNKTWSNLIQWIRDLIVRWQSDLVNINGVFLVCVKRYYTNLKNILKLKEIKVCWTVHWIMLTVQVLHLLSKFNHMFKIHFYTH